MTFVLSAEPRNLREVSVAAYLAKSTRVVETSLHILADLCYRTGCSKSDWKYRLETGDCLVTLLTSDSLAVVPILLNPS